MIAIKNIEMPKSCVECKLSYVTGGKNTRLNCIMIRGIDEINWMNERHKDCPLAEVKDENGEYEMNTTEALKVLEMFLYKDCSLTRTAFAYDENTVWHAVKMAKVALESKNWIPVSERLPEEKGYYLVTRKNPRGYVTKARFNPNQVERGVYNSSWGNGDADILAWMPVPKPYECEEEE